MLALNEFDWVCLNELIGEWMIGPLGVNDLGFDIIISPSYVLEM